MVCGTRFRFTPPASAIVLAPVRRLSQARWTATSDDDCAVSTVMLMPRAPSRYEIRLASMPRCVPASVCRVAGSPLPIAA
ncbi:hypothetical protein Lesp02_14100 [Lentzea sp. NBRC 105346]|nr:hypothetical protein Lesp02_14100 [Lentzea sp. NBRC 105346]